ncbi:carboxypeptidase-like regulatory domain-containing protein [Flammeovirga pacifica]|uniref:Erythromycin esterase n=1 Tax=Flammeovirga pacifica TaxID=915059 RepID=A0A1S1YSG4_FLAPC|nr:carboxypeptidase-like regulatory domain-containing protein [Flammeovirga pacifica]OHX63967.1 hypothetical protein NH26_20365 [Flammeovirga pacifica]
MLFNYWKITITIGVLFFVTCFNSYAQLTKINDYRTLKSKTQDSDIILLGEADHYNKFVLEEKVNFTKYLHDSLGFDLLLFESSVYDMDQVNQLLIKGTSESGILFKGIYNAWHHSKPMYDLSKYILASANKNDTLFVGGFDPQFYSGTFFNNLSIDFNKYLKETKIVCSENYIEALNTIITQVGNDYSLPETYNERFRNDTLELIQKLSSQNTTSALFWIKNLTSILGTCTLIQENKSDGIDIKSADVQLRDSLMYENIKYHINTKNKKIICWAANTHIANDLSGIHSSTDTTIQNFKGISYFLNKYTDKKITSIAFTDLAGIENVKEYIEYGQLSANEKAYIKLDSVDLYGFSSLIGNSPITGDYPHGNWKNTFNYGIIIHSSKDVHIEGEVVDASDLTTVPYVNIQFENSNIYAHTDLNGKFSFKIKEENLEKKMILSHLGYETISIQPNKNLMKIELLPNVDYLDEVEVSGKKISGYEYFKPIIENHLKLSPKTPTKYTLYYQSEDLFKDTLVIEASLEFIIDDQLKEPIHLNSTISNKRIIDENSPIFPYPIAVVSDPYINVDNSMFSKKFLNKIIIDSIQSIKNDQTTYTSINYHTNYNKKKYKGTIIVNSNDNFILNHKYSIEHIDRTLKEFEIRYAMKGEYIYPTFAEMHLKGTMFYRGTLLEFNHRNTIFIMSIVKDYTRKIYHRIYDLKKAKYSKKFWDNLN